jgi:hypothetical protein
MVMGWFPCSSAAWAWDEIGLDSCVLIFLVPCRPACWAPAIWALGTTLCQVFNDKRLATGVQRRSRRVRGWAGHRRRPAAKGTSTAAGCSRWGSARRSPCSDPSSPRPADLESTSRSELDPTGAFAPFSRVRRHRFTGYLGAPSTHLPRWSMALLIAPVATILVASEPSLAGWHARRLRCCRHGGRRQTANDRETPLRRCAGAPVTARDTQVALRETQPGKHEIGVG